MVDQGRRAAEKLMNPKAVLLYLRDLLHIYAQQFQLGVHNGNEI